MARCRGAGGGAMVVVAVDEPILPPAVVESDTAKRSKVKGRAATSFRAASQPRLRLGELAGRLIELLRGPSRTDVDWSGPVGR